MKTKKQNKLKVWLATFGVALFSGLVAIGSYATENYKQSKAVSYNDNDYEITIPEEENKYTYTNLYNYLYENRVALNGVLTATFGQSYEAAFTNASDTIYFAEQDYYGFNTNKQFVKVQDAQDLERPEDLTEEDLLYDEEIVIKCNSTNYTGIKNAVEQDYRANNPESFSEQIINSIKSGLGLIGQLAQQFLLGFTTLFWTGTALTEFGIFSLCFLGLAISFAIVRLVMNIVRSNTGV